MSANLTVDLGQTTQMSQSFPTQAQLAASASGQMCGASGYLIGNPIDMLNSDTFCNLYVAGTAVQLSGSLIIGVQCADSDTSGNYTDPTSGLPTFPTVFSSGGLLWIGSGTAGTWGASGISGQFTLSGFAVAAGFQRIQRFARVTMRGDLAAASGWIGNITAGFVSQFKTTGSGGGYSYLPGSGTPSV